MSTVEMPISGATGSSSCALGGQDFSYTGGDAHYHGTPDAVWRYWTAWNFTGATFVDAVINDVRLYLARSSSNAERWVEAEIGFEDADNPTNVIDGDDLVARGNNRAEPLAPWSDELPVVAVQYLMQTNPKESLQAVANRTNFTGDRVHLIALGTAHTTNNGCIFYGGGQLIEPECHVDYEVVPDTPLFDPVGKGAIVGAI